MLVGQCLSLSTLGLKLMHQLLMCVQEAAQTSAVQQGRQYRAHAKSSSSDSSQSPPRQRARQYCLSFVSLCAEQTSSYDK